MNENFGPREIVADGIADAIDGEIPLRWVALVESMDQNGRRSYWRFASDGMVAWDALALLNYGDIKYRADIMQAEMSDGE